MSVTIVESAPPLSETDLDRVEERMGRPIPKAYRTFLLMHNGGRPEPYAFRMRGRNNKTDQGGCVDWLFGVNTGEYYSDLERYAKEFHERLPSNIFAIGSDPGGNLICLSTTGEDEGAVYFWDHEEEADVGEMPTHVNTYFIAKTFDDFLNSLFDYEEE